MKTVVELCYELVRVGADFKRADKEVKRIFRTWNELLEKANRKSSELENLAQPGGADSATAEQLINELDQLFKDMDEMESKG